MKYGVPVSKLSLNHPIGAIFTQQGPMVLCLCGEPKSCCGRCSGRPALWLPGAARRRQREPRRWRRFGVEVNRKRWRTRSDKIGKMGEFTNVPMGIEWEYDGDRKPSDLFLLWLWAWMIYSQSLSDKPMGAWVLLQMRIYNPPFFWAGHLRSAMTIGMLMMMMMIMMMMNTAQTL